MKKIYLIFLFCLLFVQDVLIMIYLKDQKYTHSKILSKNAIAMLSTNSNIIDSKPRNLEWEQINRYTFFRRNSSFFFSDISTLKIFYITNKEYINFTYTAKLMVFDKFNQSLLKEFYFKNNSYDIQEKSSLYQFISITISNISLNDYEIDYYLD